MIKWDQWVERRSGCIFLTILLFLFSTNNPFLGDGMQDKPIDVTCMSPNFTYYAFPTLQVIYLFLAIAIYSISLFNKGYHEGWPVVVTRHWLSSDMAISYPLMCTSYYLSTLSTSAYFILFWGINLILLSLYPKKSYPLTFNPILEFFNWVLHVWVLTLVSTYLWPIISLSNSVI